MTHETNRAGAQRTGVTLTPEQEKRRRKRNVALALGICAFITLFYIVTIVKLGGAAGRPPG